MENSRREIESVRMIEWRALASRFWRIYDISLSRRTKGWVDMADMAGSRLMVRRCV